MTTCKGLPIPDRRALLSWGGVAAAAASVVGMPTPATAADAAALAGRWHYRSFHNAAKYSENLDEVLLAEADVVLAPPTGNKFTGTLGTEEWKLVLAGTLHLPSENMLISPAAGTGGGGSIGLDGARLTMRGTQGNAATAGWVYAYVGWIVPPMPGAVGQATTIVGSVHRVVTHGERKGGLTYSFLLVKQK